MSTRPSLKGVHIYWNIITCKTMYSKPRNWVLFWLWKMLPKVQSLKLGEVTTNERTHDNL